MSLAVCSPHSLSDFGPTTRDLFLGGAGSMIALTQGYCTMRGSELLMKQWGLEAGPQFAFQIYDSLEHISNPLGRAVLKVVAIVYVILLMPVIEEWLFREVIYTHQLSDGFQRDSLAEQSYRVVLNGLLFGAFHLNPFQGWVNVPIFAVSTISGIAFATLREMTQNLWAPTIAHSLNNTFVVFITFLKI